MPALVEIDRLRKEFRGETAIDNLTASLAKGWSARTEPEKPP